MKLAKKMLASVMALAMIAALALTAFAAAPVVTLTADDYANVGDTVKVVIDAKDIAGLTSADLVIKFDAEALKVAEEIKQPAGAKYTMGSGGNTAEGEITWSFFYLDAADADTVVLEIAFEVLKAGDTTVSLSYADWQGTDVPAEASVVIAQKEETTEAPTTEAPTTEAPTTEAPTTEAPADESEVPTTPDIPQTGEAGVAAIAGVMALAAVAFVATRKKDEE